MPYSLLSDTFADEQEWEVLAGGNLPLLDALQAAYVRLHTKASHLLTNGYLTEQTALRYCHGKRRVLERLTAAVLDRPPQLHRRGDDCPCLGDDWVDGYAYRIHGFLRRNPSRAEYERNRAQKADLRDARLKAAVYSRDGGCCRYCRSGPLSAKAGRSRDRRKVLTYDHVDPDAPAGPDGAGLVVACGACNEHKGHRTPDEADMALLDPPSEAQAATWAARGLALFDRPDHRRITDRSPTDQQQTTDPTTDRVTDRISDPDGDPIDDGTGPLRPENGDQAPDQAGACSAKGDGTGRGAGGGVPARDPPRPALPVRTSAEPDVYHRRSRAIPRQEGLPP